MLNRKYYRVYTRTSWQSPWWYAATVDPVKITIPSGLAIATATLVARYGSGLWNDLTPMSDAASMDRAEGYYVRITVADSPNAAGEKTLFVGQIPSEEFVVAGQSAAGVKTADHIVTAVGCEALLDTALDCGYVLGAGSGIERIDWLPPFNGRTSTGGITGNRSVDAVASGFLKPSTYVFARSGEVYQTWSYLDMLNYLLVRYAPSLPKFGFENLRFDVAEASRTPLEYALGRMTGVFDPTGKTLRQFLAELLNPSRGLNVGIVYDMLGNPQLKVWSMLDQPLWIGDLLLPAHDPGDTQAMELWRTEGDGQIIVAAEKFNAFDRITVRGANICAAATYSIADGSLEAGWTADEQDAYKAAASGATGYSGLSADDKAKLNDAFRSSDRMAKVFAAFTVPRDWDWITTNAVPGGDAYDVSPKWDALTGAFTNDTAGICWNLYKRFLPYLPFKEGLDYSTTPPTDRNRSGAEPDWRRLFAVVQNNNGKYVYADRRRPNPANVFALADQMGAVVRFNPQHTLALNHWTSAEPTLHDPATVDEVGSTFGADYTDVLITAMTVTDQVFALTHVVSAEGNRTLTLELPDASLWIGIPGTVVDVAADGTLVRLAGTGRAVILRDDSAALKTLLAAAAAWYGRTHWKATLTYHQVDPWVEIGTLLTGLNPTGPGGAAAVSQIVYDFTKQTTIVTTDAKELDLRTLMGAAGAGSGKGAQIARTLTAVQREIADLRRTVAAPKRDSTLPGGAGAGGAAPVIWAIVTQIPEYNDPTKAKFLVQRASVDSDTESETYNQWIGDGTPIDIERALGFEGVLDGSEDAALDIRNWTPWPGVGAIVPIIQRWDAEQTTPALRWYMDIPMLYGGDEAISSIRQNPAYYDGALNQNITQVVWV